MFLKAVPVLTKQLAVADFVKPLSAGVLGSPLTGVLPTFCTNADDTLSCFLVFKTM